MSKQRKYSRGFLLLGGCILFAGLPLFYMLNASHEWSGGGLLPVDHWNLLPASAFPAGTLQSAGRAVMFTAVLCLAAALPTKPRKVLFGLLLAGAGVLAMQTLHYRLTPRSAYDWTGLFVSRNQYAAFACLLFPAALSRGARAQYEAFQTGRLSNPSGLFFLVAALLAVSVIQTGSRAGIVILVLQAAGFIGIQWRIRRDHPFAIPPFSALRKVLLGGMLALAIGVGIVSLIRNLPAPGAADADLDFRRVVRADTLTMWRDRKWWGTGPGTFARVFPYYQTLPVEQYYFRHAHCEPLQFLAEFGLLGAGLMILGGGLILMGTRKKTGVSQQLPTFKALEGQCLLLALGGVFLHGLVDFPLRHVLILLVSAIWIGILARGCGRLKNGQNPLSVAENIV